MSLQNLRKWAPSQLRPVDLPERFREAELERIEVPEVREVATQYWQDFWQVAPNGIAPVFLGHTGRWKTYAACAVLRKVQGALLQTAFLQCAVDLPWLELQRYADSTLQQLRRWQTVPFLVLDDFGSVPAKGWMAVQMVAIVAARFSAQLPTLVTGNRVATQDNVREIERDYGAIFARRLRDGGRGYFVVLS